jgi:hypothetical protein
MSMRKSLLFVLALLIPVVASAQVFDPNLEFVIGGQYATTDPGPGLHRGQFLFSANMPGLNVLQLFGQPLYLGGVGFDLRTVDQTIGTVVGFALAVPALTYHIKGGPVVLQAGVTKDLMGTDKTTGFYGAFGAGLTTPKAIAAKRARKKAERELLERAKREHPDAIPPPPRN